MKATIKNLVFGKNAEQISAYSGNLAVQLIYGVKIAVFILLFLFSISLAESVAVVPQPKPIKSANVLFPLSPTNSKMSSKQNASRDK